jgi:ABC-type multidrug transport system ATPase subunit
MSMHFSVCPPFLILGHNGSGKSSTINCLSGVTVCTYGEAFLFGFNCKTEINSIRERMGVCSQFDFLYPSLTGAQHILLYATFRCVTPKQGLKAYVDEKLDLVDLGAAANLISSSYSGGMKRRLSVALATVGNKLDILFLDEPTTGLDPMSKRKVWDVIESYKKDRIVVLTSHSMEEVCCSLLFFRRIICLIRLVFCMGVKSRLKARLYSSRTAMETGIKFPFSTSLLLHLTLLWRNGSTRYSFEF